MSKSRLDMGKIEKTYDTELLNQFNSKDCVGFGAVYSFFHRELNLYASYLYRDTDILSEDVIHDIFTNIWQSDVKFESLMSIKAYLYVSIKNGFKNYLVRNNRVNKYIKHVEVESNFNLDMIECEIYSFIDEAMKVVPENCKEVLRLYIDGCKSGEIAKILGKTEQSVYNIKNETIKILREKLKKDKFIILIFLLN